MHVVNKGRVTEMIKCGVFRRQWITAFSLQGMVLLMILYPVLKELPNGEKSMQK